MTPEYIKRIMKSAEPFKIHHTNGNTYFLDSLVQIQSNGEWIDGAIYHGVGVFERYCRALTDFKNFKHITT